MADAPQNATPAAGAEPSKVALSAFLWDYAPEAAAEHEVPPQAMAVPAALLEVPGLDPAALMPLLPPRYVIVRLGDYPVPLPEVPAPPTLRDDDPASPFSRMTRLAELAFATGGTQRLQLFEHQIALVCAAFSAREVRRQYLPPPELAQWDPLRNLQKLWTGVSVPSSRAPSLGLLQVPDIEEDILLSDGMLAPFRAQVVPSQPSVGTPATDAPARDLAARTLALWRRAARTHAEARLDLIAHIEDATRAAGMERMQAAMDLAAHELARYTGLKEDSAHALLELNPTLRSIALDLDRESTKDLEKAIRALRAPAQAIEAARGKAMGKFPSHALRASEDLPTEAFSRSMAEFERYWESIVPPALAAYAAEVAVHARYHPILFRVPAETVLEVAEHGMGELAHPLLQILHRNYQSAKHMRMLLREALRTTDGIQCEGPEAWLTDVEARVARQTLGNDWLWRYPTLIRAGLDTLAKPDPSVAFDQASAVVEALTELRRGQAQLAIVETVGFVEASLLLTVVAPPLGAAFDLIMAGKGVLDAIGEYEESSALYFCTLNPTEAFTEQDPNATGIVLSVAFAALAVAPVLRGLAKAP